MKYLIIIISLIILTGCANPKFLVCGVDVKEITKKDVIVGVLGAGVSLVAHVAGHYIAAEIFDIEITQVGAREVILNPDKHSKAELEWFARGGFVLQLSINTVLVHVIPESFFTKGYTTMTGIEITSYPYRYRADMGDFYYLNDFECPLYMVWAEYLNARIK